MGLETIAATSSGHFDNASAGIWAAIAGEGKFGDIGVVCTIVAGICSVPVALASRLLGISS